MESKEQEIEKVILKTIANYKNDVATHKKQISFIETKINKLNNTLSFLKKADHTEQVNTPIQKRKYIKKTSNNFTVSPIKVKSPPLKWDELIIPLLKKSKRGMSVRQIAKHLSKGKDKKEATSLYHKLSVALVYMKKHGKIFAIKNKGGISLYKHR